MDKRVFKKLGPIAEQVVEAYKNGMTLTEIGKLHGVAAGTVRNLLISIGIPRRKKGKRAKEAN